jgi:dTMP kinase
MVKKMDRFITFEGGDGCGKTTQSKKLHQYLISKGVDAIWTREIGGTDIAEQIRDIVVTKELLKNTELLLILSARNEHIERVIKPAILDGKVVICDRFIDSTAAYQGSSIDEIKRIYYLNGFLFENYEPHRTIYVRLDPEVALNRAKSRGENNKYENKNLDFHKKVSENYEFISNSFSSRIKVVDGNQSEEEIFKKILDKLGI